MTDCTTQPSGQDCLIPTNYQNCKPWDLTLQGRIACYADSLVSESLQIAGAQVNVFKMLGVYEQTKLLDLVGTGTAISGGDAQNHPAANAFTTQKAEWWSRQTGAAAIIASAYIGYDFGVKKVPNGRVQYGIPANIYEHITTIRLKQGANSNMRVTTARLERSQDGKDWYGVAILQLPTDGSLATINFKQSVPSRFWRLRPLTFLGGECDSWAISSFEMHDYAETALNNIQDPILLENRDRDYQQPPVLLKGYYDLTTTVTDLTMFGQATPSIQYQIKIDFNTCVTLLGRPIVIGDIIELPSETQFKPDLTPVKRYLEVSDVTWDPSSYAPSWVPLLLLVTAVPALATQETRDIFGDLAAKTDDSGLFNNDDGNNQKFQDYSNIDQTIRETANDEVPERGSEGSNVIREFTDAELTAAADFPQVAKMNFNRTGLYVEDAMPQNDAPFTRGDVFPTNPKDGDYFRMEYTGLAKDVPARLYRYSTIKGRFLYLETDRRAEFDNQKSTNTEYVRNLNKISAREIK